jgi:hypothetical protein
MKKLLSVLFVMVILPKFQPMFPGMIVRCDDQGHCLWECEFGVVNSTETINANVVEHTTGCKPKTPGMTISSINPSIEIPLTYGDTVYHGILEGQ